MRPAPDQLPRSKHGFYMSPRRGGTNGVIFLEMIGHNSTDKC